MEVVAGADKACRSPGAPEALRLTDEGALPVVGSARIVLGVLSPDATELVVSGV
jgi:hypothetical protein